MGFSIMIVDDSVTTRKVISKAIKLSGIEIISIIEASNGKEALNLLEDNWVDIIISDINMPEMNGIEFIKKLKEHNVYSSIPVIVVSTEGRDDILKDIDSYISGYIKKPFQPEQIKNLILNVLGVNEDGGYKNTLEGSDF